MLDIQFEPISNTPLLEGQPWKIYIIHETGLRIEEISPSNAKEFVLAAFYRICEEYSNQKIAAALFSPEGKRIEFLLLEPTKYEIH